MRSPAEDEGDRMSGCIFCDIVQELIPAKLLHKDDRAIAFQDIAPKAPTHFLVVPRAHLADLDDAAPDHAELLGHLLLVAKDVASKSGLTNGYRVVINRGSDAGQTVHHLHLHVLGGRAMGWPPG
jgi:histidine triad (HIT) family protein